MGTTERCDPALWLKLAESRRIGRNHNVRGQHQLNPYRVGDPVHD
jgi:hypothetical protein